MVTMQSLSNKKLFPSASNDRFSGVGSVGSKVKLPDVRKTVKGARLRQVQKDLYKQADTQRQQ